MASIRRDCKSSMLWEKKEELLDLYNATNGTNYTNLDDSFTEQGGGNSDEYI